ncbi:cation-translocating P-type ATPase [Bradyrhizobium sp.]|uniref:heavy metal translocating P-type ATPase n=1 Tax=Bradyrhizobium sp. TaxID=376 RepID=UPI002387E14D|nr:cation-translocating P-type ATPase [Bradyrhizobium sp.]MDE1933552.1 cadmium-translocating P-type ATPase [Bradyrhizobium sp.]MDE2061753.1 cadmium-translocating P-type ATPase [Bradyrhizobium sp.]
MTIATGTASTFMPWSEEPSARPNRRKIRARIGGLHCSLCTGTIEKALGRLPGVDKVAVSLTHEQALVEYDPAIARPEVFLQTLHDIGYAISDPRKLRPYEEEERDLVNEARRFVIAVVLSVASIPIIADQSVGWIGFLPALVCLSLGAFVFLVLRSTGFWIATASFIGLAVMALTLLYLNLQGYLVTVAPWLTGALALVLVFGVGRHILHMAFQALRRGILNQHVLLEIGAFAGIAGGVSGLVLNRPDYPTAAFFAVSVMVGTYHIFSEWLSLIVKTRSSQAVKRLLDLQPETARVVRNGKEIELPIEEVRIGDPVRVRPGERIPGDGVVVSGHSGVDQSLVTGESIPIEKTEGATVIGGSINGTGTLLVKVTAVGEGSFLSQVIRQVEDARALKPGLLHLVDRVLRIYTPSVLVVATLAVAGWLVGSWLSSGQPDIERAVFAGLSVLVMGYPCAVGISAPLSIVRGAGQAAERGILMRTGEAFQGFRLVQQIALDKTGTLTEGRPVVREIKGFGAVESELLALAAAAEASSEHPLAQAVVTAAFERGVTPPAVETFEALPGKGVTARIGDHKVIVGNPRFLTDQGADLSQVSTNVEELEAKGLTVIGVARNGRALGIIALGDTLRPDAIQAVAALHRAGLKTILVTGDNERAAQWAAREVGINEFHAGILPQDKAVIVRQLQGSSRVAMVGDGINDAPALMQADVGIAMGGGTDIAIESADIIILSNRLNALVDAREISSRSYRKMVQNVALAFLFNGVGIPIAATGLLHPVWAMVAMAISVTAIFINSLWGTPRLFFDAIRSVGQPIVNVPAPQSV